MTKQLHEKANKDGFVKELALFLGTARFNADLSQKELSELSGVKAHSIQSLENAIVKKPNLLLILKISIVLNIDIEEFMGLKKEKDIPLKERLSLEQVDELNFSLWDTQKEYDKGTYKYSKSTNKQEHYNRVKKRQRKYISIERVIAEMKGTNYTLDDLIRYSSDKSIDTFYSE